MNKLYYKEDLPFKIKGGKYVIDWANSVGKTVRFDFNEIHDILSIQGHNYKTGQVMVKYKDALHNINTDSLKNCKLSKLFSKVFLYQKDDIINGLKITDSFFYQHRKFYKYTCLKCTWNDGEISESNLKIGQGCSCCNGKTIVAGINDIPTTDPWMVDYFQGGYDEAKLYSSRSAKKIFPKCPDCGKIKNKAIYICNIFQSHSIGCECSDGKSYPNKFIIALLKQLNVDFDYEKTFSWAKQYRYDAVIYLIDRSEHFNITIEMDGGLGHGDEKCNNVEDILKQRNDILDDMNKEICALKNGNYHIRIDCLKSDKDYIKNNILNSKLAEYFDLSNIDWDKCDQFALKNIVKEICDYIKNNDSVNYNDISNKFCISKSTVGRYLKRAKNNRMINDELYERICNNGIKRKKLYVYSNNKKLINTYISASDFVKNSEKDFGFKSSGSGVAESIKRKTLYHNSVYLSYEPLN